MTLKNIIDDSTGNNLPLVGVAIAAYNNLSFLVQCLDALERSDYPNLFKVVADDGSTDDTSNTIKSKYIDVHLISGDGNLWWTGATNLAIKHCMKNGCELIVLINPDVTITKTTISSLVQYSNKFPMSIIAPLVVCKDSPSKIWWGGSSWGPLSPCLPVWTARYICKRGTDVSEVPLIPYHSDEAHGRGVLVPIKIFRKIGFYDEYTFQHYAADSDFSFRAREAGFQILIVPEVQVLLEIGNTGHPRQDSLQTAIGGFYNFLFSRKHGETAKVWWRILKKHAPAYAIVPSYLFIMSLNIFRYWQKFLKNIRTSNRTGKSL